MNGQALGYNLELISLKSVAYSHNLHSSIDKWLLKCQPLRQKLFCCTFLVNDLILSKHGAHFKTAVIICIVIALYILTL